MRPAWVEPAGSTWPASAELAVRASARRPRSVIALRCPSGRPSAQPAVG